MATLLHLFVAVVAAALVQTASGTRSVPSSTLARMWDRNATHIAVESLTEHQDVVEGRDLSLECVVSVKEGEYDDSDEAGTGASPVRVQWLLVSAEADSDLQELASDSEVTARSPDLRRRLRSVRRRSWDAVADANVQDHVLTLAAITEAEMGIYICQVKLRNSSVVASKHTYVTVLPRLESLPDASPTFDPKSVTAVARSEDLTTPDVGSVKDIIVVKKGRNVTLECRDADSATEVYWRKLGDSSLVGTGRHLRLIRVEKWDSGLYLCGTSKAGRHDYNVTLLVNAEPVVTSANVVVVPSEGGKATLTCKVEAVPVAQITWYRLLPTEALPAPHTAQTAAGKRALGSSDELSITIGMYKDGVVESSLNVYSVEERHYGTYLCEARNGLGEDSIELSIAKVRGNSPSSASSQWTTRSQRISFTVLITLIVQTVLYL